MLLLTWDQFTIDSQTERDGSRPIAFLFRRISSGIPFYILEIAKASSIAAASLLFSLLFCQNMSAHIHSPITLPPLFKEEMCKKMELQRGGTESAASLRDEGKQEVRWSGPVVPD